MGDTNIVVATSCGLPLTPGLTDIDISSRPHTSWTPQSANSTPRYKSRIPRRTAKSIEGIPRTPERPDQTHLNTHTEVFVASDIETSPSIPSALERQVTFGVENPTVSQEKTFADSRTPRYQATATSYEELLENLNESDPFNGEPPPRKPRLKTPDKEYDKPPWNKSGTNRAVNSYSNGIPPKGPTRRDKTSNGDLPRARSERRKSRKKSQMDLNSTYTKDDIPMSCRKRPSSATSTGTYVIERDSTSLLATNTSLVNLQHKFPFNMKKKLLDRGQSNRKKSRQFLKESGIIQFVQDHFKHRVCNKYVKDGNKDDGRCQCGRDGDWHDDQGMDTSQKSSSKEKWKPTSEFTITTEPDSFGTIQFHGFGLESSCSAPYIRVDHETKVEDVWDLLSDHWLIPAPKLIISVTGGAKRFFMKARLKSSFKRGLINAAKSTGAWIVTGGSHAGVMEFVGEAVRDHHLAAGGTVEQQVVALGIATWGSVDNKASLVSDGQGLFPAIYSVDDLSPRNARGVAAIDCNHTHFILVDNGTERKFGAEIKFRASLEQYISEHMETGVARDQTVHVPVVQLVLEGGENTLQTANEAMQRNIPIVVIQGSGRAADFIAYGNRLTKSGTDDEKTTYPTDFDQTMTEQAEVLFDWSRERDQKTKEMKIKGCVASLRSILDRKRILLTVFEIDDVDTSNEIDEAILYALLKANRADAQSQLNLALAWNRCDIARTEIFTIENRSQWQHMDIYGAMFTALVQDRVDFVQLFLDSGVNLRHFLTIPRLRDLYDDVVNDPDSGICAELLQTRLLQVKQNWRSYIWSLCGYEKLEDELPNLLGMVGKVVNFLLAEQTENIYGDGKFVVTGDSYRESPQRLLCRQTLTMKSTMRSSSKYPVDFDNPEKELFIWAILLNRRELAHLFWRLGKDHMATCLMGSALLKSMAKEAQREEEVDLALDLQKHSQECEEKALGVLTECYMRNKLTTHMVLIREVPSWQKNTVFSLANSAELMDFMAHSACQTKLNRIWKGRMALHTPTWKIILAMVLPIFIPLIKYTPERRHGSNYDEVVEEEELISDDTDNYSVQANQIQPLGATPGGRDDHDGGDDGKGGDKNGPRNDVEFVRSKTRRRKKRVPNQKLCKVTMMGKHAETISLFKAFYFFHISPITKFYFHSASYLIFLAIFSIFLLTDLWPTNHEDAPNSLEFVIWIWASTFIVEEIRQVFTQSPKTLYYKCYVYFGSVWNIFDGITNLMLILSVVIRYVVKESDFIWARMLYALTLALYFIRFYQNYFVAKNIGPKVIMIKRMMSDLVFFFVIWVNVYLAYGVASQSLRFPNSEISWDLVRSTLSMPYWQMYGELMLEDLEGDIPWCSYNATIYNNDPTVERCPEQSWLVIVLFAVYLIMTNILLLNLLIAMFSYTFEEVQENSEKVWRFHHYSLIHEYFDRPTIVPPFIILSHIWRCIKYICQRCSSHVKHIHDFCIAMEEEENKKMAAFEHVGMELYLRKQQIISKEHIDAKVQTTGERIEKVIVDLEQIKEHITTSEASMEATGSLTHRDLMSVRESFTSRSRSDDLSLMQCRLSGLEDRISQQGEQMKHLATMMEKMMTHMKDPASASSRQQQAWPHGHHGPYASGPEVEISEVSDSGKSS